MKINEKLFLIFTRICVLMKNTLPEWFKIFITMKIFWYGKVFTPWKKKSTFVFEMSEYLDIL